MYDLNSVVVPGSGITDIQVTGSDSCINDSGQIAAYGTYVGEQVALLLTPTPEPGSGALALFGGLGLLLRRRRKNPAI